MSRERCLLGMLQAEDLQFLSLKQVFDKGRVWLGSDWVSRRVSPGSSGLLQGRAELGCAAQVGTGLAWHASVGWGQPSLPSQDVSWHSPS